MNDLRDPPDAPVANGELLAQGLESAVLLAMAEALR